MSFDREQYKDIAPYVGKDVDEAIVRLSQHPEFLYAFAASLFKGDGPEVDEKRKQFVKYVLSLLKNVHSYDDFQHVITSGLFLKNVISNTMESFTVSGVEKIKNDKSYLFISNHRDIVLDCALLDYALFEKEKPLCEMAIGDNLLKSQLILDIFKLNGAIIVKRDLSVREKYIETVRLSEYFYNTIQGGKNIWLAQKSGRSKDGIDVTHPAIIKMLYLGPKKDKLSFSDVIKNYHIVPVSISYEMDPNAINKAREEIKTKEEGEYNKKPLEDVISMVKGIREWTGRVNLTFGDELTDTYQTPEEVAAEVDRQIHANYTLWPNNWFSYDYLNNSNENSDKYEGFDKDGFLAGFSHLTPEVRDFVLNSFANPVRSFLGE